MRRNTINNNQITEEQEEVHSNGESKAILKATGSLPKKMVNKIAELLDHIVSLRLVVVMQFIVIILSFYQNYRIQNNITVHIPPNVENGVIMKLGEIPRANVLVYASYLWIEFNTWGESGDKDAYDNLVKYENYFGEDFVDEMSHYYDDLKRKGELDRTRRVTLATGSLNDVQNRVKPITSGSWVVYLDVIDEERFDGKVVKRSKIRYPLLVERVDTTMEKNPIGVRIVGYAERPTLLDEY